MSQDKKLRGFPVNPEVVLSAVGYVPDAPSCGTCMRRKEERDPYKDRAWVQNCYQFGTLGPVKILLTGVCNNYERGPANGAKK